MGIMYDEQEYIEVIGFDDFISNKPLRELSTVKCLRGVKGFSPSEKNIQLFCGKCETTQFFNVDGDESCSWDGNEKSVPYRISLVCRNCEEYTKVFLLRVDGEVGGSDGGHFYPFLSIEKLVEYPMDFQKISTPELSLLGSEREDFFKGLRCERDGLGAAAFLYYRRVIERRRDKIFESVIKVIKDTIGHNEALIGELEVIKNDGQFVKSADAIKAAFPDSLLIVGQNPLYLLYGILSAGVHEMTDEECLEYAKDARLVLLKLSEKIDMLLKESKELKGAVSRLASVRQNK